ncbi:MAG: amidohydrolase [Spirochaetaceae bacterium]|nr:MAG: amidohydrolase [Spirochaetaceae bacterium]
MNVPPTAIIVENVDYVLTTAGVQERCDLVLDQGRIAAIRSTGPIGSTGPIDTEMRRIDGRGKAALAGFKNAHTHAAMTLLRGYGDDMRLLPWLQERIWPAEAQLTGEDIYWGTRLAALEMISSGTTFANDMYFQAPRVRQAFRDAGMRAAVGYALFDFGDSARRAALQEEVMELLRQEHGAPSPIPDPVFPTIAPHSIYTCSGELLQWAAALAADQGLVFHIHMSETEQEVRDCLDARGLRPFQWLEQLGVLEAAGSRMIAAHAVWLDRIELDLVAKYGVTVAHNPASNMKLASGCFPWREYADRSVPVMLAPDGVASNNNLDMFDEMKLAALLQKHHYGDPTRLPAEEILAIATGARSTLFADSGVGGALTEGGPADVVLVDLDHPQMVPVHNLESNLAYAANGGVVDTVICAGQILMEGRTIPDSREVLQEARHRASALAARARP